MTRGRKEFFVPAFLLALVALGWCSAAAIWTPATFIRPASYLEDATKSDTTWAFAILKANVTGEAAPFSWKTVDWPNLDKGHCLARGFTWYSVVKFAARLGMHRPSALLVISFG
jgi:hypothetical protein